MTPLREPVPTLVEFRSRPPAADQVSGGSRPRHYQPDAPLVSVVCICRNAATAIAQCIQSVASQDYPNVEFIIHDGQSTDGTIELLRLYDSTITSWSSERDKGRSEAANKAVARATGEYLTMVMADDWLESDFISASVAALRRSGADYVFGDCMMHDPSEGFLYRRVGAPDFERDLRYWMTVNSPSFTIRRAMLDEIGLFREFSVSADYDWFIRAHVAGYRGIYDPSIRYHFRTGGVSSTAAFHSYRENLAVALAHGSALLPSYLIYWRNVMRHLARSSLEFLLPLKLVLSLRRWRQGRLHRKAERFAAEAPPPASRR